MAVIVTFALYHLARFRSWDVQSVAVDKPKDLGQIGPSLPSPTTSSLIVATPIASREASSVEPYPHAQTETPVVTDLDASELPTPPDPTRNLYQAETPVSDKGTPPVNETERVFKEVETSKSFKSGGQGRLEISHQSSLLERPHWRPQKEKFPVPSGSVIQLPTGRPKSIPAVQHEFSRETSTERKDNDEKLGAVKEAFKHAWNGYKEYARAHDELSPISKGFKDPFNGWGATLVDTLDTLWIMDLKDEFEEAIGEVSKIDFKTSIRKDIPLFETVIRYLGGLIAAHDVSSGQYPILLTKATELAEILMGSFDTPNRMPVTYYYWAPSYASQPHRAASKVVLAELGSLSLEFTRLAQLTQESKYYDAVARITNELEIWQNSTNVPGLWPVLVDASGCKKPDLQSSDGTDDISPAMERLPPGYTHEREVDSQGQGSILPDPSNFHERRKRQSDDTEHINGEDAGPLSSDQLAEGSIPPSHSEMIDKVNNFELGHDDCEPQGFASPPFQKTERFTMGGMADSTYEYLPKEWLLLGGLNDQYESMYKAAMDVVRNNLLFRPMTNPGRDVLFTGTLRIMKSSSEDGNIKSTRAPMEYEGQHLTCFAGGMFALGAKVFSLKDDLEVAAKLTEGCVWAYESMTTGIMPELFQLVPCDDQQNCSWNETKWWEALDPLRSMREMKTKEWHDKQKFVGQKSVGVEGDRPEMPLPTSEPVLSTDHAKRHGEHDQIQDARDVRADNSRPKSSKPSSPRKNEASSHGLTPHAPVSHEEYVLNRIEQESLPPGFTEITSKKYILRPEAIESVFILYRVTGDKSWQERGWKMFNAIQKYTRTEHGNSAITDVTSKRPFYTDQMESFWLAETLKYFYLLYSDPNLMSLDDYVL